MPPSPLDRALRRLVARLAEATAEDREAVLSDLSAEDQEEIARLLAAYRGLDVGSTAPTAPANAWTDAGFSPLLVARLDAPAGFGMRIPSPPASADFPRQAGPELTPLALEALRECAGQVRPRFQPPPPLAGPAMSEAGLFRRLWGMRSL